MKRLRSVLTFVLAVLFVGSTAAALWLHMDYRSGEQSYDDAQALAFGGHASAEPPVEMSQVHYETPAAPEVPAAESGGPIARTLPGKSASSEEEDLLYDPYAEKFLLMDLEGLQEVNPDGLGWLYIPGTGISYPLLQGDDNEYYLNYTWDNRESWVGSIFMEYTNSPDFSDFNTILYGHNLANGTMFTPLHNYDEPGYWEEHQYVYVVDASGAYRYRVFAAFEASVTGPTYWLGINNDELKQGFLDYSLAENWLDTGIIPTVEDSILTMSTCTAHGYDSRWVVQAVLEGKLTHIPPADEVS